MKFWAWDLWKDAEIYPAHSIHPPVGNKYKYWLAAILLFTAALYCVSLKNDFINWDDPSYITENELIRDLSGPGLVNIFTSFHFNGYLPLTQLSLALDYYFWKDNATGYHLTNLLLHLANILLVFFLSLQVSGSKNGALITCLLFALHPMRVESVVWAAERKDVLCAFFFFLSLIFYFKYLKSKYPFYLIGLSFLFFVLSVFSKWSAYPLPVILILADYYSKRRINLKSVLEKIIFLAVPLISVFIHFSKGVVVNEYYTLIQRFFLGTWSFVFYCVKFVLPVKLTGIYPYPDLIDGHLPPDYYLSPLAVLAILGIVLFLVKKYSSERRFIVFCFFFVLINLGMVLHVLSSIGGVVVVADRYTYIAYLGFFLLTGKYAAELFSAFKEKRRYKNLLLIFFSLVLVFYAVKSLERIRMFKNSEVFFNDILKNDPSIPFAWNNLGFALAEQGKQVQAIESYQRALTLKPDFTFALNNRGLAYDAIGKYDLALDDFTRAITIKNSDATLFFNRGLTNYNVSDYKKAIEDFSEAINLNPAEGKYYMKRGAAFIGQEAYEEAKRDFLKSVELLPLDAEAYNYLGLANNYLSRLDDALESYNKSIALNPAYSSAYNNRGWVKFLLNDYEGAMADLNKSVSLDPEFSFPYYNLGMLYYEKGNPQEACAHWKKALQLGYEPAGRLLKENCKL